MLSPELIIGYQIKKSAIGKVIPTKDSIHDEIKKLEKLVH